MEEQSFGERGGFVGVGVYACRGKDTRIALMSEGAVLVLSLSQALQ